MDTLPGVSIPCHLIFTGCVLQARWDSTLGTRVGTFPPPTSSPPCVLLAHWVDSAPPWPSHKGAPGTIGQHSKSFSVNTYAHASWLSIWQKSFASGFGDSGSLFLKCYRKWYRVDVLALGFFFGTSVGIHGFC